MRLEAERFEGGSEAYIVKGGVGEGASRDGQSATLVRIAPMCR